MFFLVLFCFVCVGFSFGRFLSCLVFSCGAVCLFVCLFLFALFFLICLLMFFFNSTLFLSLLCCFFIYAVFFCFKSAGFCLLPCVVLVVLILCFLVLARFLV